MRASGKLMSLMRESERERERLYIVRCCSKEERKGRLRLI
jgi:hypothetical protein